MLKANWRSLIGFFVAVIAVQIIGGIVTSTSVSTWYAELDKPSFNPPPSVFAPVWTALYITIAISGWLAWVKIPGNPATKLKHSAIKAYSGQLAANLIWSFLFFGFRNPEYAFYEIIILLWLIILTIYHFARVSRIAAVLLLPYLAWVSFAALLTYKIAELN